MSRTYHPRMLELHKESVLYPGATPYSFEWWVGMSAFAYLCWQWGQMPTDRWAKLDRWIFQRTYKALDEGRYSPAHLGSLA